MSLPSYSKINWIVQHNRYRYRVELSAMPTDCRQRRHTAERYTRILNTELLKSACLIVFARSYVAEQGY